MISSIIILFVKWVSFKFLMELTTSAAKTGDGFACFGDVQDSAAAAAASGADSKLDEPLICKKMKN